MLQHFPAKTAALQSTSVYRESFEGENFREFGIFVKFFTVAQSIVQREDMSLVPGDAKGLVQ